MPRGHHDGKGRIDRAVPERPPMAQRSLLGAPRYGQGSFACANTHGCAPDIPHKSAGRAVPVVPPDSPPVRRQVTVPTALAYVSVPAHIGLSGCGEVVAVIVPDLDHLRQVRCPEPQRRRATAAPGRLRADSPAAAEGER